jgi:hypothetical protein
VPANSTVIAEWWAALRDQGRASQRYFADELRRHPQVDRDWDLDELKAEINRAISVATDVDEFVSLVDNPGSARRKRLGTAVSEQRYDRELAARKAARSGRCTHNVAGRDCPLCDEKFKVVYISGGGRHWHLDSNCEALESGQEKVRLAGGEVAEVHAYGASNQLVFEKDPCRTCLRELG